jgi:hypothetical protein
MRETVNIMLRPKCEASIRIDFVMDCHFCSRSNDRVELLQWGLEMVKLIALGLTSGLLSLSAAIPTYACGGGSCGASAATAATATAKAGRSNSCQASGGKCNPQMAMQGGMMGTGSGHSMPRSADAKAQGN